MLRTARQLGVIDQTREDQRADHRGGEAESRVAGRSRQPGLKLCVDQADETARDLCKGAADGCGLTPALGAQCSDDAAAFWVQGVTLREVPAQRLV